MTEEEFWKIVDSALIDPSTPFFLEDHYLSYWNALAALPDEKLAGFAFVHGQIKQRALTGDLAKVLLRLQRDPGDPELDNKDLQNILAGLISRGSRVFGDFLLDPEGSLLSVDRPALLLKCEAFDYAPIAIHIERTGEQQFDFSEMITIPHT